MSFLCKSDWQLFLKVVKMESKTVEWLEIKSRANFIVKKQKQKQFFEPTTRNQKLIPFGILRTYVSLFFIHLNYVFLKISSLHSTEHQPVDGGILKSGRIGLNGPVC